jgi:hypothetical protein
MNGDRPAPVTDRFSVRSVPAPAKKLTENVARDAGGGR